MTAALVAVAKERNIATVLVGHVTKDGKVAGPRVLEHLVDVVLHFEGDKHSSLRLVRGLKNRFGAADEVGCFEMHEGGIACLADPSGLFLTRYAEPVPGTCVTVAMEGRRALVTEVQALIGATSGLARGARSAASTRPAGHGARRAAAPHQQLQLHDKEVFAATVGGIRRHRAGRRPGHRAGGRLRRPRPAACRPTWWRSARSVSPARSAGSARSPGGSPRRPGSASGTRWCRPAAARRHGRLPRRG